MKKNLFLFFFFLWSSLSFSQSLTFCEKVKDGTPVNPSHIFTISRQGGFFNFLVVMPDSAGTGEVKYDIFSVDEAGKETFFDTVIEKVEPEWVWFSKEVTFYKPGDYTVYVYSQSDRLLCTGFVKVVMK